MGQKTNTVPKNADDFNANKIMIFTLLSTTCRIFLPTLGLFGIGAIIDFNFETKPYGMIVGTAVGIIISAILVALQIRSIKKGKK